MVHERLLRDEQKVLDRENVFACPIPAEAGLDE
jgi:hypothetical protein